MFILYFDEKYFEWSPMLIESIMISEPEERICIYGIELPERQIERIRSYSCVEYIPCVLQETEFVRFKKSIGERPSRIIQKMAYFILNAFCRFPEEKLYMVLNVDSLVVNPLAEIKQKMVNYDIGVSLGGGQVRTGFILMNCADVSKKFVEDWNSLLMDGPCYWGKDQHTLFQLYQKSRDKIRFLEFGGSYRDPSSMQESHIWSAYKTRFGSKAERYLLYEKKLEEMKQRDASYIAQV